MKKVITMILFAVFINVVVCERVFAHGRGGCMCNTSSRASHRYISIVPPRPVGWPHILFAKDVVKSFYAKELNVEKTGIIPEEELDALPGRAHEGIEFSLPTTDKNLRGCVLSFKKKKNFEKIKHYYLDLNQKGLLHSWSFTKDNILVVLDGTMSEEKVGEFKVVLDEMSKSTQKTE